MLVQRGADNPSGRRNRHAQRVGTRNRIPGESRDPSLNCAAETWVPASGWTAC